MMFLLEEGQKSSRFHVGQLDFSGCGGHAAVKHGIKHRAPNGQGKSVGRKEASHTHVLNNKRP